jgi:hypothetical protein
MRIAAGIMLIISGTASLAFYVPLLCGVYVTPSSFLNLDPIFRQLLIPLLYISAAFIFPGGVFCLERKHWKLCFAAALLAFLIMIYWIYAATGGFSLPLSAIPPSALTWGIWFPIIAGVLPIIFVCIRKREWQEIPGEKIITN